MLNLTIMVGRLCHSPEVRDTQSGIKAARLRLAVKRDVKGKDGTDTDFFSAVAYRTTAEYVGKYCEKGKLLAVVGKFQNREYTDKDGNKRQATELIVDHVYPLEKREESEQAAAVLPKAEALEYADKIIDSLMNPLPTTVVNDDELPF